MKDNRHSVRLAVLTDTVHICTSLSSRRLGNSKPVAPEGAVAAVGAVSCKRTAVFYPPKSPDVLCGLSCFLFNWYRQKVVGRSVKLLTPSTYLLTYLLPGAESFLRRSLSSSLCSLFHSPVTSSLLGPNILLNTIFSNTPSFLSSLNGSDQVSHPYKTGGKIITPPTAMVKNVWNCTFTSPPRKNTNCSATRQLHAHAHVQTDSKTRCNTKLTVTFFQRPVSIPGSSMHAFRQKVLLVLLTGRTVVRVVSVRASGVQSEPGWPPV